MMLARQNLGWCQKRGLQGDLIHTEPLGLCPEDAYEKMVDTALDNLYNDIYWREQFSRDVWIHKQLELI